MTVSKKDSVMKYLIELPDLVSVLKLYEIQVRNESVMMIDNTLPAATDGNGDDVDIFDDKWYSHLSKKYPAVHTMAMSVILHGSKVNQVSVQWVI